MTESEAKTKWCIVDAVDADLVGRAWWHGRYFKSSKGYIHRIVAQRAFGIIPDGMVVDHIDSDTTNNRRRNLRYVTQSENVRNSNGKASIRKSIHRGVSKTKSGKWIAQITVNSVRRHLGTFPNEDQAAIAYKMAQSKYCGLARKA